MAISRETAIAVGVTAVALVAVAFDHLVGPDPGLEDPIAFVVSVALTIVCALLLSVAVALPWPRCRRAGVRTLEERVRIGTAAGARY